MSEGYKIQPESTGGNVRITSIWINSINVLQQGVSIADPSSGWQQQVNSAGGALGEVQNIGVVSSMYAAISSIYSRLAHVESWSFVAGAALVSIKSGAFIAPYSAYDADQAVTDAGVLVAIPAGATKVELGMVSGTIAIRAAFGDAAVLASPTQGVRISGIAAGTNPVLARIYDIPSGATSMHLDAESAGTSTISIAWGT